MLVISWQKSFEVLSKAGRPPCQRCGNRSRHFLVKKKRGVKLMFIPVYKGSDGYATVCEVCNFVRPIDDREAKLMLLRYLGTETSRLHLSRHLQTAADRVLVANIIHDYVESGDLISHAEAAGPSNMTAEQLTDRALYYVSWKLTQELGLSAADADEIVYLDDFTADAYVNFGDRSVVVNQAELDAQIAFARTQIPLQGKR